MSLEDIENDHLVIVYVWDYARLSLKSDVAHIRTCRHVQHLIGDDAEEVHIPLILTGVANLLLSRKLCRACFAPRRFDDVMRLAEKYQSEQSAAERLRQAGLELRQQVERNRAQP